MVREYTYSPHYDFFIDKTERARGYDMKTFHLHKKYEIYYEISGARRYYIEDSSYLINAGNIVLIGPDSVHKTGSVDDMPHARYVINFNEEYLQELIAAFPDADLLSCFNSGIHVLTVSPKKQQRVEQLMARLWSSSGENTPQEIALRKFRLGELLLTLNKYVMEAKDEISEPGRIRHKTIDNIQEYISSHYTQQLTLSQIAAQFYISPHYLSRLFKKTTGLSLTEYINSVRLVAAKNLLENSNHKIANIGEEVGFTTTTHFSRVFKEGTGLSPQQYRKLYRHTSEE